jgi:hypothetical protein
MSDDFDAEAFVRSYVSEDRYACEAEDALLTLVGRAYAAGRASRQPVVDAARTVVHADGTLAGDVLRAVVKLSSALHADTTQEESDDD